MSITVPTWLLFRVRVIVLTMAILFLLLGCTAIVEGAPFAKVWAQKLLGFFWIVGIFQAMNIVVVYWMKNRVVKWAVGVAWVILQLIAVTFIPIELIEEIVESLDHSGSNDSYMNSKVVLLLLHAVYWGGTYCIVRRPTSGSAEAEIEP